MHDLLIEMINEVEKDMEVYKVKKKLFRNENNLLCPTKAYRTSELLKYMYIKASKDSLRLEALVLLEECFKYCTRNVLYFINIGDLKNIIYRHKEEDKWCIQFLKNADSQIRNAIGYNFLEYVEKD